MLTHSTIGLLGGSFNPAHAGHLHLSLQAIKRLKLDAVWWLLTPQNPLKQRADLADYDARYTHAQQLLQPYSRRIILSDFEARHGLHYSVDTIAALQQRYPHTRFVWLMGADNLAIFHRWNRWQTFFESIPIAIFDRAPFAHSALHSPAALRYKRHRIASRDAALLASQTAPAWLYDFMPRHAQSSTDIRKTLGKTAFLSHNNNI